MSVISMPLALARSWESGFGSEADHPLGPGVHHQGGDAVAGGAEPDLAHHLLGERKPWLAAGHERRGERDHGRAVHVIVHHGLGEGLYKAGLDLEALRRRDSSRCMPPNVGEMRTTVSTNSSTSLVSIRIGIAETPASWW